MVEGFREQQKYEDLLHGETLSLLRYIGYTTYIGIPTKKSIRKQPVEKYYPLRFDKKPQKKYTKEYIKDFFNEKQPYITNGKLRGYIDRWGNLEKIN